MKHLALICMLTLTLAAPVAAANTVATSAAAIPQSEHRAQDLAKEDFHEGKRCNFTKLEAIVTGVAWFFGGIPGAIITPLACKKDLFQ